MRILEYVVPEEFSNRPVLHFLKGHLKLSTKIVQSLRHTEGSVTANDRVVRMIDNVYKDEWSVPASVPLSKQKVCWYVSLESLLFIRIRLQ